MSVFLSYERNKTQTLDIEPRVSLLVVNMPIEPNFTRDSTELGPRTADVDFP